MKKQIRIIIVCIFVVIGIISFIVINSDEKQIYDGGVKYALTIDGNKANNFPSKGMYKVSVNCTNATGKWLYDEWKLSVQDITDTDVTCNIDFETVTKTYFNNYIIGLKGLRQGTGQVVNEKGYRYEGLDPNNYVWFNNEYWRVIGVFNSTSHGQSGKNLDKLNRSEPIGAYSWNVTNNSNYVSSYVNKILTTSYYNATNGTSSGNCYSYYNTLTGNCDFTVTGLQASYRKMLVNAAWHLGGISAANLTIDTIYTQERGTTVYGSNPTTTTAHVGLMYPSDFGYSVLADVCPRTTLANSYASVCGSYSWLNGPGYEWTINPSSADANKIFMIMYSGNLGYSSSVVYGFAVRPTIYLDASVYVLDGEGSYDDPYIVSI